MNTRFVLPWDNTDLDIHPEPPEGWHRVAVVGGWTDKVKIRERWLHAAVCGPLRTVRGIDLLVRGLLANPQIRVLVWDGPDLTPSEATRKALFRMWARDMEVAEDLADVVDGLIDGVALQDGEGFELCAPGPIGVQPHSEDRFGGTVIRPPPIPKPSAHAPHGDPGDRIAGDTLADVWPRVLKRALECGREVPTQYGESRELLNLVSVIREPANMLHGPLGWNYCESCKGTGSDFTPEEAEQLGMPPEVSHCRECEGTGVDRNAKHPVLGLSWTDIESYYERLTGPEVPEGTRYVYGSRMRGTPDRSEK